MSNLIEETCNKFIVDYGAAIEGMEPNNGRSIEDGVYALLKYIGRWQDETYTTIQTEIGFVVDLGDLFYCGRIDRYIDTHSFGKMPLEMKSTGLPWNWSLKGNPNLQIEGCMMGIYANTGEMPMGGVLDILPAGNPKVKKVEPERYITFRSKQQMEIWLRNIQAWWKTLCSYREQGYWPQNTETCVPLLGYQCEYIPLCQNWPDGIINGDIPTQFIKQEWKPFDSIEGNNWIDYTKLSTFLQCPRKYYWKFEANLSSPASVAMLMGGCLHDALAFYYNKKMVNEC